MGCQAVMAVVTVATGAKAIEQGEKARIHPGPRKGQGLQEGHRHRGDRIESLRGECGFLQ